MPSLSFRFLPFFALHSSLFTFHSSLSSAPPLHSSLFTLHSSLFTIFSPSHRLLRVLRALGLIIFARPSGFWRFPTGFFFLFFSPLWALFCFFAALGFPAFFGKYRIFCPPRAKKRADGRYCVYSRQKPCRPSHAMPDRNARRILRRTAAAGVDRTWQVCYTDGKARQDRSGGHRVADPLPRCARHTEAYTGPLVGQGRPSTDKGSKRDALL